MCIRDRFGPLPLSLTVGDSYGVVEGPQGRVALVNGRKVDVLAGAAVASHTVPAAGRGSVFFSPTGDLLVGTPPLDVLDVATGAVVFTMPAAISGDTPSRLFQAASTDWRASYQASDGTVVGYAVANNSGLSQDHFVQMWHWRPGMAARTLSGPVTVHPYNRDVTSNLSLFHTPAPRPGATPGDVIWAMATDECARTIRHLDGSVTDLTAAPWATGKIALADGGCVVRHTPRGYLAATHGQQSRGQSGLWPDHRPTGWLSAGGVFTPDASLSPFIGSAGGTAFKRLSFSTDTRVDDDPTSAATTLSTLDGRSGTLVRKPGRACRALDGGRMLCTDGLYTLDDPLPRGTLTVAPASGTAQTLEATAGSAVRSRDGRTLTLSWEHVASEGTARHSRRLTLTLNATAPLAAGTRLPAGLNGVPGQAGLIWVDQTGSTIGIAARAESGSVTVDAYTGSAATLTLHDVVATVKGTPVTFRGTLKVGLVGVQ